MPAVSQSCGRTAGPMDMRFAAERKPNTRRARNDHRRLSRLCRAASDTHQMINMSRRKGARVELETVHELNRRGIPATKRLGMYIAGHDIDAVVRGRCQAIFPADNPNLPVRGGRRSAERATGWRAPHSHWLKQCNAEQRLQFVQDRHAGHEQHQKFE
jgi:hypothetical protein